MGYLFHIWASQETPSIMRLGFRVCRQTWVGSSKRYCWRTYSVYQGYWWCVLACVSFSVVVFSWLSLAFWPTVAELGGIPCHLSQSRYHLHYKLTSWRKLRIPILENKCCLLTDLLCDRRQIMQVGYWKYIKWRLYQQADYGGNAVNATQKYELIRPIELPQELDSGEARYWDNEGVNGIQEVNNKEFWRWWQKGSMKRQTDGAVITMTEVWASGFYGACFFSWRSWWNQASIWTAIAVKRE